MSTQLEHPGRAAARTIVQTVTALAWAVPLIVQSIGDNAPVWLVPILTGVVVWVGVLTRIMADPRVNALLARLGLSAEPAAARVQYLDGTEPPTDADGLQRLTNAEALTTKEN